MLAEQLLLRRILLLSQYLLHQSLLLRAYAWSLQVLRQVGCVLPGYGQHLVLRQGCSLHSDLLLDLLSALEILPVRSMLIRLSAWVPGSVLLAHLKEASVGVLSVGVDCEVGRLSQLLRVRCRGGRACMCPALADVLGLLLLRRWLIAEQAASAVVATFGIDAGRVIEE